MNFFERKLSGTTVYRGKVLNLDVDKVRLGDGTLSSREVVRHSGGVAVLLVENGSVLLVKQFRYAYGKELYEIPAGRINPGEEPIAAARRELGEETGYSANLVPFLKIYPSPGYTDEIIYIYLAENSTRSAQNLDEGEFLSVESIPFERVCNMIASGEITDAKTVSAIFKYAAENK